MITADSPGNGENQNITIIVDDSNGHHVISAPHPNVSTHNIVISDQIDAVQVTSNNAIVDAIPVGSNVDLHNNDQGSSGIILTIDDNHPDGNIDPVSFSPSNLNVPESFPEKPPVHVAMKTSKAKRLLDDYVIRSIHVDNNSPEKNGPGSIEFDYNNELFTMKVNWKDNMRNGHAVLLNNHHIIVAELEYVNDRICGWVSFRRNDVIWFEGNAVDDHLEGEYHEYNESGIEVIRGVVHNGIMTELVMSIDDMEGYFMELSEQNECISISQYDDFRQKKNGRCFFFKNGVLARECLIESDNMIQVKREFVGKQMKEFDECNRVSYVGEYVGSMKEGYHRTGMGIEYKNGKAVYCGWMEDGVHSSTITKSHDHPGYCEERNCQNDLVSIAQYDRTNVMKNGLCFMIKNQMVIKECVYDNNELVRVICEMNGSEMIQYDEDGYCVYIGEYAGDIDNGFWREGNGMEQDRQGNLIYQGSYVQNHRCGKGTVFRDGEKYYSGEWVNDRPHGKGTLNGRSGYWRFGYLKVDQGYLSFDNNVILHPCCRWCLPNWYENGGVMDDVFLFVKTYNAVSFCGFLAGLLILLDVFLCMVFKLDVVIMCMAAIVGAAIAVCCIVVFFDKLQDNYKWFHAFNPLLVHFCGYLLIALICGIFKGIQWATNHNNGFVVLFCSLDLISIIVIVVACTWKYGGWLFFVCLSIILISGDALIPLYFDYPLWTGVISGVVGFVICICSVGISEYEDSGWCSFIVLVGHVICCCACYVIGLTIMAVQWLLPYTTAITVLECLGAIYVFCILVALVCSWTYGYYVLHIVVSLGMIALDGFIPYYFKWNLITRILIIVLGIILVLIATFNYHSDLLNHNNYYTTLSSFVYHIFTGITGAICYGVYIWLCKLLEGFPLITIVILIAGMVIGTATGLLIEYFVVSTDNGYYVTNWILSIVLCFIDVYLFNDDGLIAMCVAIGIKTVSLLVNCCYKNEIQANASYYHLFYIFLSIVLLPPLTRSKE